MYIGVYVSTEIDVDFIVTKEYNDYISGWRRIGFTKK